MATSNPVFLSESIAYIDASEIEIINRSFLRSTN